ncbi:hypothetical protein OG767_03340 [Micromonospora sp. NBC_01392]|uniref:hypothetical protein n=1 Tax=Micromonospora sp. NBC_01392 TaxID=2903588 RepID=UPI0032550A07
MDDFWNGAVSALIGAVVGGAASWIAARIQVRGAIKVANMQTRQTLDAQRLLRREEREHEALKALRVFVDKQLVAFSEVAALHEDHEPDDSEAGCAHPTTGHIDMAALCEESARLRLTHGPFLHPAVSHQYEYLHDAMHDCKDGIFQPRFYANLDLHGCKWKSVMVSTTELADWISVFFEYQLEGRGVESLLADFRVDGYWPDQLSARARALSQGDQR